MDRMAYLEFIEKRTRAILQEFRDEQQLLHTLHCVDDAGAPVPIVGAVLALTRHGIPAAQALAVSYQAERLGCLNDYVRIDEIHGGGAPVPGSDTIGSAFVDGADMLRLVASSEPKVGWVVLERARQGLLAELAAELLSQHVPGSVPR